VVPLRVVLLLPAVPLHFCLPQQLPALLAVPASCMGHVLLLLWRW
jgi:hypothetical protein